MHPIAARIISKAPFPSEMWLHDPHEDGGEDCPGIMVAPLSSTLGLGLGFGAGTGAGSGTGAWQIVICIPSSHCSKMFVQDVLGEAKCCWGEEQRTKTAGGSRQPLPQHPRKLSSGPLAYLTQKYENSQLTIDSLESLPLSEHALRHLVSATSGFSTTYYSLLREELRVTVFSMSLYFWWYFSVSNTWGSAYLFN